MYNASVDNKRVCALPRKRLTWKHDEIMCFLNILKQKKRHGLFDRKQLRVADFYEDIEETMSMAGFKKTAIQLSIKFKNIKAEYLKCKRNNTDIISEGKIFPYFKAMDELFSTNREHFEVPLTDWSHSSNSSGPSFKTELAHIEIEEQNIHEDYDANEESKYFIYEETVPVGGRSNVALSAVGQMYREFSKV